MLARLLIGAVLLGQAATAAPANPTIYLASWQVNEVGFVNDNAIAKTVPVADLRGVGFDPIQTALSPNGSTLYTLGRGYSTPNGYYLTKIDTRTGKYAGRVRLGFYPLQFAITPDDKRALIRDHARITSVNLRTGTFTYFKNLSPIDEALSPDGRTLYDADGTGLVVIDTVKDKLTATVPIPGTGGPSAVAVSPDSKTVYVLTSSQINVIDAATRAVTATIPIPSTSAYGGRFRQHLAITPDGHQLYAYTASGGASYSVIDLTTNTMINTVTTQHGLTSLAFTPGGALGYGMSTTTGYTINAATGAIVATSTGFGRVEHGVVLTSDDRMAVIADGNKDTLVEQDLATNTRIRSVAVGTSPTSLSLDGHGRAFVANGGTSTVSVVDLGAGTVTATVHSEFASPSSIAVSPDGKTAYLTGAGTLLRVFDTGTNKATGVITGINTGTSKVLFSPDGSRAYLTGYGNQVSVLDTATRQVIARPALSEQPIGMAVSSDGRLLYVTTDDGVTVLDTATNTVTRTFRVSAGQFPSSPVLSPDGATLYVNVYTGLPVFSTIAVIDTATGAVTSTFAGGDPIGIAQDGAALYAVTNGGIQVFSTADDTATTTISTPSANVVKFGPDGSHIYLLNGNLPGQQTLATIATATNTITSTASLAGVDAPWNSIGVGPS